LWINKELKVKGKREKERLKGKERFGVSCDE
jgi:hypothetical protein